MKLDQQTIAKRYSRALFELAIENQQTDEVMTDLKSLVIILKNNPDFITAIDSPNLPQVAKQQIIVALKQDAHKLVANLIQMVFDYNHFAALPAISVAFETLVNEQKQIIAANVVSAVELTVEQKQRLATEYAKRVGAKQVVINTTIDSSIIGGVIIESAGRIIDGSVATKIAKLKRMLVVK
ncbi:ATP synthase F1 subunit delta [Periweissella beninensis]|uniref:ATP synthase subunit delta n=1 Tax=Periweissella beninensis TaxID=504936 RepID=A0ABT0VFP9_9LACO|nr:ATP synthase F1 subunit delta [Periweissella beninensis]MBM7543667.1 F-type H+-transporting ATPase subunit delta [Periweissella beninensis]MCM2436646.1 F0F1 ATP synthase subunit delta [Periweissella beninensis]MCT4395616.1 F0F1 ATP synthase subunit delta [Periweissella beninensis]